MIFAELSDAVLLAIIGLVGLVVKDWLDGRRADRAAKKVDLVKKDLAASELKLIEHRAELKKDVTAIKADQKVLVRELNGLKADQLKEHGEAEYAKGLLKGEARDKPLPPPPIGTEFDAH